MKPYEERYFVTLKKPLDDETFEIIKSESGNIKVIHYYERWRKPKETIKVLKAIIKTIEKEFMENEQMAVGCNH